MSRNRLVFSRPRTKVYDANYNIGENYYKSALDGIDRKYGRLGSADAGVAFAGLRPSLERERAAEPPSPRAAMRDLERDEFADEFARSKKSSSMLGEFDSLFESRMKNGTGSERATSRAMKAFEDEIEEDLAASVRRLKAGRAARTAAEEMEEMEKRGERSLRSKLDFSDKIMDSVGLSGKARAALEEEMATGKRSVLKITATSSTATESSEGDNMTRWTALKSGSSRRSALEHEEMGAAESAAAARARKSRAMLDDIEAEMQAIAERGAAREKRVRDLKALVEENEASSMENLNSTMRIKSSLQSEKKMTGTEEKMSEEIQATATETKTTSESKKIDVDKPVVFKHWVRPRTSQYSYLYDYRRNYYDDVIDYLDRRKSGVYREVPRPQTWAERALRTYTQKLGTTENAIKARNDTDLIHKFGRLFSETGQIRLREMPAVTRMLMRAARPRLINAERPWTEILQIRGPGNSAFLIEMDQSKDVYEVRFLLKNFILGKHKCKYEESGIPQFEKNGFVLTKPLQRYHQIAKKAVLHSNAVGAEKVIEMRESKQLQFVCKPSRLVLTARKLGIFGYEIDSTGVTYFPLHMVCLCKRDQRTCDKFLRIMDTLPNVVKVYDNIFR